jgi:hypothetical protein
MRLLLLLLGVVLGVAATLAYATFASSPSITPAEPLPADPQITVVFGERFIAELVRHAIAETPNAPTIELTTELRDDAIAIAARVDLLTGRAEGQALLRPILDHGKLKVDVIETTLGAMPVPALEQLLERQINDRIRSLLAGMPVVVSGVRVDRMRGLTVTCRVDLDSLDVGFAETPQ